MAEEKRTETMIPQEDSKEAAEVMSFIEIDKKMGKTDNYFEMECEEIKEIKRKAVQEIKDILKKMEKGYRVRKFICSYLLKTKYNNL